jgi:adenylate kinase
MELSRALVRLAGGVAVLSALCIGTLWAFADSKPPLVLLLIGPPGSGKGTQAAQITKEFGIPHISTGELLRAEVAQGTELGRKVRSVMEAGQLVDDDTVNQLVARRIGKPDARAGFILDGYPRTLDQARFLDDLLHRRQLPAPLVLHIDVPPGVTMQRLLDRGRADDQRAVIEDRLRVYVRDTAPILGHYSPRAGYHRINGDQKPEQVYSDIQALLRASRR